MTLFTKSEPTSDEFRKIADIVAEELSLTEHYVDLWFDYQIWKHREYLEGGVCRYLGPWRSKALAIGGSYFDAAGCTSLKQIDAIPLAYFANINIEKQLPVINEILIPYLFHFQTSRTPPKLHFFFGIRSTSRERCWPSLHRYRVGQRQEAGFRGGDHSTSEGVVLCSWV